MLTLPLPGHGSPAPARSALTASAATRRPDLDGLRGVAVLSLLAIHCVPVWSRGGVMAIDIFFVLSGFLTTVLVRRLLDEERFSYPRFVQRRLARLAPAALLVLVVCLAFAVLFTPAAVARDIGRQVAWAASMLSDVRLARSGASASPHPNDPVLAFWVVGVVVQFALVWPLVLRAVRGTAALRVVIVAGLAGSLAFDLACAAQGSWLAYHLLAGRWWELMAGAALATLPAHGAAAKPTAASSAIARDVLSWSAPVLLASAALTVDRASVLPGAWALLPVLAACLSIAAGPRASFNRHVLAQPVLRFYGLVAYPLALWHWAVLSFPVILEVTLSNEVRVLVLIAAIVLAALTYELVEGPLRARANASVHAALALGGAIVVVGLLGALLAALDGLPFTYPPALRSASMP